MTLYSLFRFIHVLSAMGVCGALAIEGALLVRLHRAVGTTEMRDALDGFRLFRVLVPVSLAPTVISGMYLMRTAWGTRAAWIDVSVASLVLALVAGVTTTVLRVAHLRRADPAGYTRDRILWMSFVMRTAIFTGIVFLMTVKPRLEESLVAIGVAAAAGFLASLAVFFRGDSRESQEEATTTC